VQDPFAVSDPLSAPADPFAPSDPFAAPPPSAPEPLQITGDIDPFAAAVAPRAGGSLPETDLAELLGEPPSPATAPPPPAAVTAAFADLEEPTGDGFGARKGLAIEGGLAPSADPLDALSSQAPPHASELFDPGASELFDPGTVRLPPSVGEEPLALATEPTPGPSCAPAPPPGPPPSRTPAAARRSPPTPNPLPAPAAAAARPQPGPASRLGPAAVNAFALVALLFVALAFRVVWRGDARLGAGVFRPSMLLGALGPPPEPEGAFPAAHVRSGTYVQASGAALLYVRGEVLSRAPGPVGSVRIEAEVVRDGGVLARGEGIAGAVPTAEELYEATDRAALDALIARLRGRGPEAVAPGDRIPFLVTLPDAPARLAGATVRVRAVVAGSPPGERKP
jgi:hypothetical protein